MVGLGVSLYPKFGGSDPVEMDGFFEEVKILWITSFFEEVKILWITSPGGKLGCEFSVWKFPGSLKNPSPEKLGLWTIFNPA